MNSPTMIHPAGVRLITPYAPPQIRPIVYQHYAPARPAPASRGHWPRSTRTLGHRSSGTRTWQLAGAGFQPVQE